VAGKVELDALEMTGDYVAVNKPAGLATIPGRGEEDSVLERLGRQIGLPSSGTSDPRVRVVHRLDKDTSGVLLFAKNVETQRHLSHQFQNNRVEKEYLALVCGRPGEREGEIDAALAPHPGAARRMAVTLGADLVDDNKRRLDDAALAVIREQVETAADALRAVHIEPGSPRALALFSA